MQNPFKNWLKLLLKIFIFFYTNFAILFIFNVNKTHYFYIVVENMFQCLLLNINLLVILKQKKLLVFYSTHYSVIIC